MNNAVNIDELDENISIRLGYIAVSAERGQLRLS